MERKEINVLVIIISLTLIIFSIISFKDGFLKLPELITIIILIIVILSAARISKHTERR